jgi:SAM-dependent methyltransferase
VRLVGALGFVRRARHLRWRGCQDQVWPVIVTSQRSPDARKAMTKAGVAGCITRSPTARRSWPWPAATFDLVVSTTSFDHWADQQAGLAECARVLAPGGCLVLADLFSALLLPTLLAGRRGKA